MRYLLFIAIFVIISANIFADGTQPNGLGTESNPYQIATLDNLLYLSTNSSMWGSGIFFEQTADIDASSTNTWNADAGFSPIGSSTNKFAGTYDGGGYEISNITINRSTQSGAGLFGYTNNAEVYNTHLINANITALAEAGCLIGGKRNTDVENCSATGSVIVTHLSNGNSYVGGLIGRNEVFEDQTSNVFRCFSDVDVNGTGKKCGGLIGNVRAGWSGYGTGTILIKDCFAMGDVSGNEEVGGFTGYQDTPIGTGSVNITNCYSSGNVTGNTLTGGFMGYNQSAVLTACFWDSVNSGQTSSAAGIGKTTTEMQTLLTYTDAGWDFEIETNNGSDDYWDMDLSGSYNSDILTLHGKMVQINH